MSTTPTTTTTTAVKTVTPLPRVAGAGLAAPIVHACAHCHQLDTTEHGALWRVSPLAACSTLYYLHGQCLAPYKAAHNLRSVEGRIPTPAPTSPH
jgi:cytochrome c553